MKQHQFFPVQYILFDFSHVFSPVRKIQIIKGLESILSIHKKKRQFSSAKLSTDSITAEGVLKGEASPGLAK
jgi:hypothetical protein